MKVVLIRSRAIDQAVNKIALSLSNSGHDVTLLVWDRQNDLGNKIDSSYKLLTFKQSAPYDKITAIFFLPLWWIHETVFLLRNNFEVIHACDLDTIIPIAILKFIKKFKLCYIIYDFYADNLPIGRFEAFRKILRTIIARIENLYIGFSDILFLVDETRLEEVGRSKIKKVVYIYNSPKELDESSKKVRPKITYKDDDCLIFYAGLILKSRGLEYMIKAVNELPNVKLILAGKIVDKELIETINIHKDKISYIGWLPTYQEVLSRTFEADILFRFSDPKHPKTKYESPNKLFEAMMCGKPIIVSDGSSMANIVMRENCGLVVPYGNIQVLKKSISEIKNNLDLRLKLGENGRIAYERDYSWTLMEKRLRDAYSELEKGV